MFSLYGEVGEVKANLIPAIAYLHGIGAHFVLVKPGEHKTPMHAGYQRKRPAVTDIDHHLNGGGKLGLFPFSIRLSALDLDSFPDDAATHAFMQARPPLVASPTRRPGGLHLYYPDTQPRHNGKWFDDATSCGGDVRSAHGYLVLWDPATLRILQARFQMGYQGMLFPSELLAEIPLKAPESIPSGLTESHRKEPSNTIVPIGLDLSRLTPGMRNDGAFEALRKWAYREVIQHRERSTFFQAVEVEALNARQSISDRRSYTVSEARATARSIADWTWERRSMFRQQAEAQFRESDEQRFRRQQSYRGRQSGASRRQATQERDARIHWLVETQGLTHAEAAEAVGVNRSTVTRIMRRMRSLESRRVM